MLRNRHEWFVFDYIQKIDKKQQEKSINMVFFAVFFTFLSDTNLGNPHAGS